MNSIEIFSTEIDSYKSTIGYGRISSYLRYRRYHKRGQMTSLNTSSTISWRNGHFFKKKIEKILYLIMSVKCFQMSTLALTLLPMVSLIAQNVLLPGKVLATNSHCVKYWKWLSSQTKYRWFQNLLMYVNFRINSQILCPLPIHIVRQG